MRGVGRYRSQRQGFVEGGVGGGRAQIAVLDQLVEDEALTLAREREMAQRV